MVEGLRKKVFQIPTLSQKKFGTHCDLVWGKLKLQTNKKNKIILKITVKIFALATLILGFASTSFAQSSATATATATLLVPISIIKTADMNFGTVAASATAGTVALDYNNVTTVGGGVTKISGNPSTASFTVTGERQKIFSISCPTTITLAGPASSSLIVDHIQCNSGSTGTTGTLSDGGSLVLKVGGTLNVPANSVAGIYTNPTGLTVTVNYN